MLYKDQLERDLIFSNPPQRIISLVPSITELLYDLGLGDRVVGITKFCLYPKDWYCNKSRIGGTKNVDFEKIKELNPDLIIANKEENNKKEVKELIDSYPVYVSDINNFEEAYLFIESISSILDVAFKGELLLDDIKESIQSIKKSNKKVIYLIWKEPLIAVGKNTFINNVIESLGWVNACEENRYPEISLSKLMDDSVDCVLLSSEPFPFKESHQKEFQLAGLSTRTILVDGEIFSWYGSRMLKMGKYFKELQSIIDKGVG